MGAWDDVRYFEAEEFDSPDEPGSGSRIDASLVRGLDGIRHELGHYLGINSGVRSAAHNAQVGGVDGSAHVHGAAADCGVLTSHDRFQFVRAAMLTVVDHLGIVRQLTPGPGERFLIQRIGIGRRFVHVDVDRTLPAVMLWLYD